MNNPNFSIITTGGCNAKCSFCTDKMNVKSSPDYIETLQTIADLLPPKFNQVSITGGEPTISPDFKEVMEIAYENFDKVVLNTNGTNLMRYINEVGNYVNHVNVSRHAIGYSANVAIFKNKNIITDEDLDIASDLLSQVGVDVNLNCVYTADSELDMKFVRDYIKYAQSVGASSVTFRYDQDENSLNETYLESMFSDYKKVGQTGCPVCRSHTILVKGFPVTFKASFSEPSKAISGIYELIYHPSAKLTSDWAGKLEVTEADINPPIKPYTRPIKHGNVSEPTRYESCGRSSRFASGGC